MSRMMSVIRNSSSLSGVRLTSTHLPFVKNLLFPRNFTTNSFSFPSLSSSSAAIYTSLNNYFSSSLRSDIGPNPNSIRRHYHAHTHHNRNASTLSASLIHSLSYNPSIPNTTTSSFFGNSSRPLGTRSASFFTGDRARAKSNELHWEITKLRNKSLNATAAGTQAKYPTKVPLIPLTSRPALPGSSFLWLVDPNNKEFVRTLKKQISNKSPYIGLFYSRSNPNKQAVFTNLEELRQHYHDVGMLAEFRLHDSYISIYCHRRIRFTDIISSEKTINVAIEHINELSMDEIGKIEQGRISTEVKDEVLVTKSSEEIEVEESLKKVEVEEITEPIEDASSTGIQSSDEEAKVSVTNLEAQSVTIPPSESSGSIDNADHPTDSDNFSFSSNSGNDDDAKNINNFDGLSVGEAKASENVTEDIGASFVQDGKSYKIEIGSIADQPPVSMTAEILAYTQVIEQGITELLGYPDLVARTMELWTPDIELTVPGHMADFAMALTTTEPERIQDYLNLDKILDRLRRATISTFEALHVYKLRAKISYDLHESPAAKERQREILLTEKLKIEAALNAKSPKTAWVKKFKELLQDKVVPPDVRKVLDQEMDKYVGMTGDGLAEESQLRNYLEWLAKMPWGIYTQDRLDVNHAEKILNEDHYGMEDVKQRILQFVAVSKIAGSMRRGKIFCLVGPPGVGKTSIGKSIARALDRKFFRISVGGANDVSLIKGHRRTYVGALPGSIIHWLRQAQSMNPVILLDEVDKISQGIRGNPTSALLEALDPEQNNAFLDFYLNVPVDLSHALFICTANDTSTIPAPLLDRMDVIHLGGYTDYEKHQIFKRHLEPEAQKKSGVTPSQIIIEPDAISDLIRWYCREPGVRSLNRYVEKVYGVLALKIVRSLPELPPAVNEVSQESTVSDGIPIDTTIASSALIASENQNRGNTEEVLEAAISEVVVNPQPSVMTSETDSLNSFSTEVIETSIPDVITEPLVRINSSNLADFAGKRIHQSDRLYVVPPVGVALSLAWTNYSGSAIFVETTLSEHVIARKSPTIAPSSVEQNKPVNETDNETENDTAEDLEETNNTGTIHLMTGSLGSVMKESIVIAYTVAKREFASIKPDSNYFQTAQLHVHFPAGSLPKDGASAGCAMLCSFLSLALNRPIPPGLAVCGEMTLTGRVIRIDGLRERVLAARRSAVHTIVLPIQNRDQWEDLPAALTENITVHFIRNVKELIAFIFPDEEYATHSASVTSCTNAFIPAAPSSAYSTLLSLKNHEHQQMVV